MFGQQPISVRSHFHFLGLSSEGWCCYFSAGTPHTAAEALLMLIESSPEPLVSPLEDACLYADSYDKCCENIRMLPGPKKNVFLYICLFLHELLKFSQFNRLDAGRLGKCTIRAIRRIRFSFESLRQPLCSVEQFCTVTEPHPSQYFTHWTRRIATTGGQCLWWNFYATTSRSSRDRSWPLQSKGPPSAGDRIHFNAAFT